MFKELLQIFGPQNPFERIQSTFMSVLKGAISVFELE